MRPQMPMFAPSAAKVLADAQVDAAAAAGDEHGLALEQMSFGR